MLNVFPAVHCSPFSYLTARLAWLALLGLSAVLPSGARAQEADVSSVKFANVRTPNGSTGNWYEADIALEVRPPPSIPGRMVSRLKVTLTVGFELPALAGGGERRIEFYRANAECIALEAGRANIRFYLPAELVKRDQLHGDPKYWVVELGLGGRALNAGKNSYATTLASSDTRKNFLTRATTAAAANDGAMVPQYLTPFVNEYPRATPSFVRRDGR